MLQHAQNVIQVTTARSVQLVTASGDKLPILYHVKTSIQLGELNVLHEFVVVKTLVALVACCKTLVIDHLQSMIAELYTTTITCVLTYLTQPGHLTQVLTISDR